MTAATLKTVDAGLLSRYSGMTILVGGVSTAVQVFVEEPSPEIYRERVFPSISLKLLSISEDELARDSEDENQEEIGYDDEETPPVRTMRQIGTPFRLTYSLDTWHKVRAGEERDLLHAAIIQKTPVRGSMTVKDVDGNDTSVWVMWEGGMRALDEVSSDLVIYHKSLTLSVLATLLPVTTPEEFKVVTEAQWMVESMGTWEKLDVKFRMSEDGPDEPV